MNRVMDSKSIALAALLGAIGGLLSSLYLLNGKIEALSEQVAQRPPVVVIDMTKMTLDSVAANATTAERDQHFVDLREGILKLKDAGYIVLAREHIVAAPPDLFVTMGDFQ